LTDIIKAIEPENHGIE